MPIEIVEYRQTWPDEFEALAADIRSVLGPLAVRIDHIGSTSVPGLAAKDKVDVGIAVRTAADMDAVAAALEATGFRPSPHRMDHLPPGGNAILDDWRKRLVTERPGSRPSNIHIRVAGLPNQRYPLAFRDYLRTHGRSAVAYAAAKRGLATLLGEQGATRYADMKDPVCDLIHLAAEEWAAATGWEPGPSDG